MRTDINRPKFKRKVTDFLCREMLYDLLTGRLKDPRKSDIEEYLKEHAQLEVEKKQLRDSLDYLEKLQSIEVTEELEEQLKRSLSIWNYINKIFRPSVWPEWLLLGLEGMAIAGFAFLFITYVPWYDVKEWWNTNTSIKEFVAQEEPRENFNPLNQLEDSVKTEVAINNNQIDSIETDATVSVSQNAKSPIVNSVKPTPEVKNTNQDTTPQQTKSVVEQKPQPQGLQGSVTKIFMGLSNLDSKSKQIVSFIESLKGTKAGEVPLGWRRPKGSYFNIRMPEKNFDSLLQYLKKFGEVRTEKEPHRIVMGQGEMRVVMWIQALPGKVEGTVKTNKKQPESVSPPSSKNQLESAKSQNAAPITPQIEPTKPPAVEEKPDVQPDPETETSGAQKGETTP